jgi:hypothetical protein
LALLVVLGLLVAQVCTADGRAKGDTNIERLENKVKQLEQQNKQLKIESIVKKNEMAVKAQTTAIQSVRPVAVQRVRTANFSGGSCEQFRPLVSQYAWNVETAMRVMDYETAGRLNGQCDPNAENWTDNHKVCMGSFGLFQISCHSGIVKDPAQNIAIAYQKYVASGNRFDTMRGWYNTCKGLGGCPP